MPLKGRVGRHNRTDGRNCQNWVDDQRTVIALLNLIPQHDGGAGVFGSDGSRPLSVVGGTIVGRIDAGMASDGLYRAILRFEDKHFPGQRSGFVDPGGKMLKAMEDKAAAWCKSIPTDNGDADKPLPPVKTMLNKLRADLLYYPSSRDLKGVTAKEVAAFAPLIGMAIRMIDSIESQGLTRLGFPVVMWGRAHVTTGMVVNSDYDDPPEIKFWTKGWSSKETRRLPDMRHGAPVDPSADVTTERLGALLLYDHGAHCRVYPYRSGSIHYLGASFFPDWPMQDLRKPGFF